MKVKINLYFDIQAGVIDWRIVANSVIYTDIANFSGNIESSHSFTNHKQAQHDAINFCKKVGLRLEDVEFFDKEGTAKPEITKR